MESVLGAFIGATVGSIGAVLASAFATTRRDRRRAAELIVRTYLVQMQDAVESLWLRIDNLVNRHARADAATVEYFDESSLYTLAMLLAQKRRLVFDGVYGPLEQLDKGAGAALDKALEAVGSRLGEPGPDGRRFLRYHRTELAEHCLAWADGRWRTLSFREFNDTRTFLSPETTELALASLNTLKGERAQHLLAELDVVAETAARFTGLPIAYAARETQLEEAREARLDAVRDTDT